MEKYIIIALSLFFEIDLDDHDVILDHIQEV